MKRLCLLLITLGLIYTGVIFAADFTTFTGQISADDINVRVDATVGSAVICTLPKGQLVEVVAEVYDWYKIRLPKTAPSYINKDLVECIKSAPVRCFTAMVIADKVNIRLGPSESSWILGRVDKSTIVNITKEQGNWYKIEPVHQSYGWVNKKFVNKNVVVFKEDEKADSTPQPAAVLLPAQPVLQLAEQLVVEGTVSPYGVVLWRKATHKLVTANKQIYLLKGNRKSLDSLNYHKVKVTGKLISASNSSYPIIDVDIIEVLN
jgi:uncharacterized protein YgiM (DUF1202 family)